jgi:hypothetical protein
MKLFLVAFLATAVLTASVSLAGDGEPLTGGTKSPGYARFEVSPAQQYLTARAQAHAQHRQAVLNYYDWMGLDYGRPLTNSGVLMIAQPPVHIRRIYTYPGAYIDSRAYGF